jgi:hypothetical protein
MRHGEELITHEPERPRPFLEQVGRAGAFTQAAHETEMRGPQLRTAQADELSTKSNAIKQIGERNEQTAGGDLAMALEQERLAHVREDAAMKAGAQRKQEMDARLADFDQSTKALSKQAMDPNRFWANAGTGNKIAALIASGIGGGVAAMTGGRNAGLDAINSAIDRDIKAQEFAYSANRDSVNAKQTAFSMAMQKYGNEDAARAAARASAMDVAAAQMSQRAALWKGTEAGNRMLESAATLKEKSTAEIAQGVAFTPARQVAVGNTYRDPRTGLVYSEKEAKGIVDKMDDREFKREEIGLHTAGDLMKEGAKAEAKANEAKGNMQERWVPTSSTGKGYFAPTKEEAVEHRTKQADTQQIIDLTEKLLKDSEALGYTGRAAASTGLPFTSTDTVKRMRTNQKLLVGGVNRGEKFGSLDKGATELVTGMTGDPEAILGNRANLEALRDMAYEKRRELEKSSTGEKPSVTPKSFVPAEVK